MSVCPAKAAKVGEIVVCTPASPDDRINPGILIACDIAGADKVFEVGGAQAIAAMTFGTETVPRVYNLTGPGSKWVLAAFRLLEGKVAVGTQAGLGEGLILAVEHLEIQTRDLMHDMLRVRNAGGIYLGGYTPLSTGCFCSGPNHVLPTAQKAVIEWGLSTTHFMKAVSFVYFSQEGLANLREVMRVLADYEGFPAHRNAILEHFSGR